MKDKIIEILDKELSHLTILDKTKKAIATEVEALYQPQIDKLKERIEFEKKASDMWLIQINDMGKQLDNLNKRIEFQVKASDTLLLQVREMEKEIDKLKEIIRVYDELKYYQFRTDTDVDEAVETRCKLVELRHKTELLKKEAGL